MLSMAADSLESLLLEHASSLPCIAWEMSPISSRKIVPLSASSNRPLRRASAGERQALLVAEQLLSKRFSGSRGTVDGHQVACRSCWRSARPLAISSLPVPRLPSISTVLLVPAICRISSKIRASWDSC